MNLNKKIITLFSLILIVVSCVIINYYSCDSFIVYGNSMYPTYSDGDIIKVKKFNGVYDVGDIIVFKNKIDNDYIIKRIVALEGDTVSIVNNNIYINDVLYCNSDSYYSDVFIYNTSVSIPNDCVYVLGDNLSNSIDSRVFGIINVNDIYYIERC